MKIDIEINQIDNGWIVENNYYGANRYFKTYLEAKDYARQLFDNFQKEEVEEK